MTIDKFIKDNNISATFTQISRNPHMDSDGWDKEARHFEVVITHEPKDRPTQSMVTYYSMGSGLKNDPETRDILDCLAMDSQSRDLSFEEFCSEFGYDDKPLSEYPEVKATYDTIKAQANKLESILGTKLFDLLVDRIERL